MISYYLARVRSDLECAVDAIIEMQELALLDVDPTRYTPFPVGEYRAFLRTLLRALNPLVWEQGTTEEGDFNLRNLFGMEPLSHFVRIGTAEFWVPEHLAINGEYLASLTREPWTEDMVGIFLTAMTFDVTASMAMETAVQHQRYLRTTRVDK